MTLHSDVSHKSAVVDPSSRGVPTADPCSSRESSKLVTLDSSGVFGRILFLGDSIDNQTIASHLSSFFKLPRREIQYAVKERKKAHTMPRRKHKGEPYNLYEADCKASE